MVGAGASGWRLLEIYPKQRGKDRYSVVPPSICPSTSVMPSMSKGKVKVSRSCLTLCDPMVCSPPGSSVHGVFSRHEYWSGLPSPSPGDLPNPGIGPRSPALQADALPSEPPGKPRKLSPSQDKRAWESDLLLHRESRVGTEGGERTGR